MISDIEDIKKAKNAVVFDNSIEIKEGTQSFLSSSDIVGSVISGVGLGFFVISDLLWAGFIFISFIVLAIYSIVASVSGNAATIAAAAAAAV